MRQIKPCPACGAFIGWIIERVIEESLDQFGHPLESGDGRELPNKRCRRCGHDITDRIKPKKP
jgi:hypothetical protein